MVQALLGAGLLVAAVGGAFDGADGDEAAPAAAAARLRTDRFDARRAFAELRHQVEMGPRPAGSAASRRLAARLRRALPRGRYEAVRGGLRNVVGHVPGRLPAIVVAAHYDTKRLPGFVGANDGAGGTAAVLELARVLGRAPRPAGAPELRFVLFDGEEATNDKADFLLSGVRGSRAYAQRHRGELRALVLLDFVADRDLRIPREEGSNPELWARLRAAARRVGSLATFPDDRVGEVTDDHTPFARAGVPAIDLIDSDFPCWHKPCDDMSAVSQRSLDLSGETVLELLRSWR
ncbi:MAG TPA: M28 family metallopeptidase [Solirubrobacteraceae bacterium]|nr:M28 family metallopeptidase [Solirubrobacteraceae bacterium]